MEERATECEFYFKQVPLFSDDLPAAKLAGHGRRLVASLRYFPVEALRPEEAAKGDEGVRFAFSHQVHKEVGLLEIFLAVIFRCVCV